MRFAVQGIFFKKLHPAAVLPRYATAGSAGMDFHALESRAIMPGEGTVLIRTGLAVQLPPDHVLLMAPRSGMSVTYPGYMANAPGVIDSDYRGEIKLIVTATDTPVYIRQGERIMQGLVIPVVHYPVLEVNELEETDRGQGGFGSTGR